MACIVFLRGVNVGGHKAIRPSELARKLAELDVVSVGASGTFVVRGGGSESAVRARFAAALPVEARVIMCGARELSDLVAAEPFSKPAVRGADKQFVTVLEKRPKHLPTLPIRAPAGDGWQVSVVECPGRFALSVYRRRPGTLVYPNEVVEKSFGVAATTRGWPTILKLDARLAEGARPGKR